MKRKVKLPCRHADDGTGKFTVPFEGQLAERIRALAVSSHTSPASWVREAVDMWIQEHRAGIVRADPERFTERNGEEE